jgi:malate synthase
MKNENGISISDLMGWSLSDQEDFISVLEENQPLKNSEEAQSLAYHSDLIVQFLDAWANGVNQGPNMVNPEAFGGLIDILATLRVMLARLRQWEVKQTQSKEPDRIIGGFSAEFSKEGSNG